MIHQGFLPFLPGLAVYDAQVAAAHIEGHAEPRGLADGLAGLQTSLEGRSEGDPLLNDLRQAITDYRDAVQTGDAELIGPFQKGLAQVVGRFSNEIWRQNTFVYFGDSASQRFSNLVYLVDTLTALRRIAGSRLYTTTASGEDKTYIRTIVGGLTTFLADCDRQPDPIVAGMVEEAGAQVQDGALQALAGRVGVTFPSPVRHVPRQGPTPSEPVAAPPPPPPDVPSEPSPEPPTTERVLFSYLPQSAEELDNKATEYLLGKVQSKLMAAQVPWPYDFPRWIRTLYHLAGELPNGSSSRTRSNITRGLARLNELTTIDVPDIRRILGPVTIAVERPLWGLPTDWPKDMPNDFGSAMVVLWDTTEISNLQILRDVANTAIRLWSLSDTQENEGEIRGGLKTLIRGVERNLLRGEDPDYARIIQALKRIAAKFAEDGRPTVEIAYDADSPAHSGGEERETISQAEWVKRVQQFLSYERGRWADPEDGRPIAETTRRVAELLAGEKPHEPRAARLLRLLFHLTTMYRQLSGVSGEAALALGREADTPMNAADISKALEELSGHATLRLDILEELARKLNTDERSYPFLLGPDGLPDLVGRYVEYLRQKKPDALGQAGLDFAGENPEMGLSSEMVRDVLGYFIGIIEDRFDAALYTEITQGLDPSVEPVVELEAGDFAEFGERLFEDIDPEKFTPYGRVFIKVVAAHRPVVGGTPQLFMIHVKWLARIYQCYSQELAESGAGDFQKAFDMAFAKSDYKDDERYRARYRSLFSELIQFLGRNPDIAEMMHMRVVAGEISIEATKGRGGLHVAGGAAPDRSPDAPTVSEPGAAAGSDTSSNPAETAGPTGDGETAADGAPPERPAGGARPSHVDEGAFGTPAIVTSGDGVGDDTVVDDGNAFVFDVAAGLGLDLGQPPAPSNDEPGTTPPIAAETEARPAARFDTEALGVSVADWGLNDGHVAALIDMIRATDVTIVANILHILEKKKPDYRRQWIDLYARTIALDRLTPEAKARLLRLMSVEGTFWIAYLLQITAAEPTGLKLAQVLPEPSLALGRRYGRHVMTVNATAGSEPMVVARPATTVDEAHFEETGVTPEGDSFIRFRPRSGHLVDIGRDGHIATGEFGLIRKIVKAQGAVESGQRRSLILTVSARDMTPRARRFFFNTHPKGKLIIDTGTSLEMHTLENRTAAPQERIEIYDQAGRRISNQAIPYVPGPNDLSLKVIREEPPALPERPPKPKDILPSSAASIVADWRLQESHRQIILGMIADSSEDQVCRILETIAEGHDDPQYRREWIEVYGQANALKRVSARAKKRLLDLMSDSETFGRAAPLLRVVSMKPSGLTLDRLFPDPPLQLGRRHGRFIVTIEGEAAKAPRVITRPPVRPDEGVMEERAVTLDRASVLMWTQSSEVDIGVEGKRVIAPAHLVRMILRAAGAVASGKRRGVHLAVFAPTISDRARRFFFSQHPQGTILLKSRQGLAVFRQAEEKDVEDATSYGPDGGLIRHTSYRSAADRNDLQVKHIEETDWHPETHRAIQQPTERAIRALEIQRNNPGAAQMRETQALAIRAVGFLKPEHMDAAHIIGICNRFASGPAADPRRLAEFQRDLSRTANEILGRFDEAPTAPRAEPPAEGSEAPPAGTANGTGASTTADPALPWTDEIKNFLDRIWPDEYRKDMGIRKTVSVEDFIVSAYKRSRHYTRAPLLANLKSALQAHPGFRPFLAELDAALQDPTTGLHQLFKGKGNNIAQVWWRALLVFVARIHGITVAEETADEGDGDDANAEELPWSGSMKFLLDHIWPAEFRTQLGTRHRKSPEEFLAVAMKIVRHPDRARIFEALRDYLSGLAPRFAAPFLDELSKAATGTGPLASLFHQGGHRVSKEALRELIRFVARVTGTPLPESDPGKRGFELGGMAAIDRWLSVIGPMKTPENSIGFDWLRRQVTDILGRVPEAASMLPGLRETADSGFHASATRVLGSPGVMEAFTGLIPSAVGIIADLMIRHFLGGYDLPPATEQEFNEISRYFTSSLEALKKAVEHKPYDSLRPEELLALKTRIEGALETARRFAHLYTSVIDPATIDSPALTLDQMQDLVDFKDALDKFIGANEIKPLEIDELVSAPQATAS